MESCWDILEESQESGPGQVDGDQASKDVGGEKDPWATHESSTASIVASSDADCDGLPDLLNPWDIDDEEDDSWKDKVTAQHSPKRQKTAESPPLVADMVDLTQTLDPCQSVTLFSFSRVTVPQPDIHPSMRYWTSPLYNGYEHLRRALPATSHRLRHEDFCAGSAGLIFGFEATLVFLIATDNDVI